jgi:hypothetical protein
MKEFLSVPDHLHRVSCKPRRITAQNGIDEYDAMGRKMPLDLTVSGAAICLVLLTYEAMK